jgi:hypothetical protein
MSINTKNPEIDGAPDVESAWSEEIKRRLTEIDAGKVEIMKQPRIKAQITFLAESEGGRTVLPANFSDGKYRPHVVVGDPNQRRALLVNNVAQETYLGVAFVAGPSNVVPGQSFVAELALMYWPNVSYDSLVPDATFTIREGPHIVGFGSVQSTSTNDAT